jgi:hypothetical protein
MDDRGVPSKWWARLLFEPREMLGQEWVLGLAVVAIALGGAWLIFWPYLPGLISSLFVGIFDTLSWIAGLFSGGQEQAPAAAPTAAPAVPTVPSPSPSPLASPLASPSPSPLPR